MYDAFIVGLTQASLPVNLLACIIGSALGIWVGSQPQLSPSMGMAFLFPLVLFWHSDTALVFLVGVYFGAMFGGAISAIIWKAAGTQASTFTGLDGYVLAETGHGHQALFVASLASLFSGLVTTVVSIYLIPKLARIQIYMQETDYFWLTIFAILAVSALSSKSIFKGILPGILGLLLAFLDFDPLTKIPVFKLNDFNAANRLPLAVVVVAIFLLAPLYLVSTKTKYRQAKAHTLSGRLIPLKGRLDMILAIIYGTIEGFVVGLLPGTGASIGSRLAYTSARNRSSRPKTFGRGSIEGVAAAEAGSSAAAGGALLLTLGLGIPGDAATSVLLVALFSMNLQYGLSLFGKNENLTFTFFAGAILAHIIIFLFCLSGYRFFTKTIRLPFKPLAISMLLVVSLAIYMLRLDYFDVLLLLPLTGFGLLLNRFDLNPVAFITAMIFGRRGETAFYKVASVGDFSKLFSGPLSYVFVLLTVATLIVPLFFDHFRHELTKQLGNSANLTE